MEQKDLNSIDNLDIIHQKTPDNDNANQAESSYLKKENPSFSENVNSSIETSKKQTSKKTGKSKNKKIVFIAALVCMMIVLAAAFYIWYYLIRIPPVETITLSKENLELHIGEEVNVSYTITPEKSSVKEVIWDSSDKRVAYVDENGKITAISNGFCTITASVDDKIASIQITVIKANKEESLVVGEWNGLMIHLDETSAVITDPLYLNNDLTGSCKIGDNNLSFTWKYDKTDEDGDYWYDVYIEGASKILTMIYQPSKNSIMIIIDVSSSAVIFYER